MKTKKAFISESWDSLWLQAFSAAVGWAARQRTARPGVDYPKYTYPQKRPNIWKFKIARAKATRPPCRESRRLPMASTEKKCTSIAFAIPATHFMLYSPWRAFQHQNGGQGEEKGV